MHPMAVRSTCRADELIALCNRIAHASGGIFGIGRVSPEERVALAEIVATIKKS